MVRLAGRAVPAAAVEAAGSTGHNGAVGLANASPPAEGRALDARTADLENNRPTIPLNTTRQNAAAMNSHVIGDLPVQISPQSRELHGPRQYSGEARHAISTTRDAPASVREICALYRSAASFPATAANAAFRPETARECVWRS
jgi:hypothetical protein